MKKLFLLLVLFPVIGYSQNFGKDTVQLPPSDQVVLFGKKPFVAYVNHTFEINYNIFETVKFMNRDLDQIVFVGAGKRYPKEDTVTAKIDNYIITSEKFTYDWDKKLLYANDVKIIDTANHLIASSGIFNYDFTKPGSKAQLQTDVVIYHNNQPAFTTDSLQFDFAKAH